MLCDSYSDITLLDRMASMIGLLQLLVSLTLTSSANSPGLTNSPSTYVSCLSWLTTVNTPTPTSIPAPSPALCYDYNICAAVPSINKPIIPMDNPTIQLVPPHQSSLSDQPVDMAPNVTLNVACTHQEAWALLISTYKHNKHNKELPPLTSAC